MPGGEGRSDSEATATARPEVRLQAATTLASARRPTAVEAERAWRAWKTAGDAEARDRLVLWYSPMVRYLAARKGRELPGHVDVEDLVSCGLLALVRAVERRSEEHTSEL